MKDAYKPLISDDVVDKINMLTRDMEEYQGQNVIYATERARERKAKERDS